MIDAIKSIARDAGMIMRNAQHQHDSVEQKEGPRNIVTKYDREIQDFVFRELLKLYPDINLIGEEGDGELLTSTGPFCILDPIDGTTNFDKGLKHSCVSIAVGFDDDIQIGCVYDPYLDDMFYAERGKGSFLNSKQLVRDNSISLSDSLVCFGTCPYDLELADDVFDLAKVIFLHSLDIRRTGTAALEICYIAAGRFDLFFENILYPWDFAAASLILEEARGSITQFNGKKIRLDKRCSIVAGATIPVEEFYKLRHGIGNS